jgi:hypothetical protein
VLDTLVTKGPRLAAECDKELLVSLENRGLIYFDVPIEAEDLISGKGL